MLFELDAGRVRSRVLQVGLPVAEVSVRELDDVSLPGQFIRAVLPLDPGQDASQLLIHLRVELIQLSLDLRQQLKHFVAAG